MPESNSPAVLRALSAGDVQFIVVGGVAAVLNGAPVNTFDLDIVHARDERNLANLVRVLDSLDAIYRMQPSRRLKPNAGHLVSSGHHNLMTNCGALDVLGTIGANLSYEDLLPHSREMEVANGLNVRVLDLPTLIAIKEQLAGEKDLAVLPILRRTLQEQQRQS